MYKLGIFVAVLFAAAKLRRLAFCVYLWIQRRMHPWKAHLAQTCTGVGEFFAMAALLSDLYGTVSNSTTTVDTCHVLHSNTSMMILAQMLRYLLTYLLNGDISLLLIRRWTSQQKRAPWWPNTLFTAQRWPLVTTARLSRQHLSIAGGTFDRKNFKGGLTRPWSPMIEHVIRRPGGDSAAAARRRLGSS